MPKKLIVPGIHGSGDGHWQRFWLQEDPESILVEQVDWHRPSLEQWIENLERALAQHPGSLVIAHSFGAIVAASLAWRPSRYLVGAALLVAPCDLGRASSIHPDAIAYGAMPTDKLSFPTILVASRNDPYITFEQASSLAFHLGSDLVDVGHAGHINIASGYGRWAHGYRLAERLEQMTARTALPRAEHFRVPIAKGVGGASRF